MFLGVFLLQLQIRHEQAGQTPRACCGNQEDLRRHGSRFDVRWAGGRIRILLGSDRNGFPAFQARRADTWHAGVVRPRNRRDRRAKGPQGRHNERALMLATSLCRPFRPFECFDPGKPGPHGSRQMMCQPCGPVNLCRWQQI
jgi:hypothetical protein